MLTLRLPSLSVPPEYRWYIETTLSFLHDVFWKVISNPANILNICVLILCYYSYRKNGRKNGSLGLLTFPPPNHAEPRIVRLNVAFGVIGFATLVLSIGYFAVMLNAVRMLSLLRDYPDVPNLWDEDEPGNPLTGSVRISLLSGAHKLMLVTACMGFTSGINAVVAAWSLRYYPLGKIDYRKLYFLFYVLIVLYIIIPVFATATTATYTSVFAFVLEQDHQHKRSCEVSQTEYNGRSVQLMRCTSEALACHVLPSHGVPRTYTVPICRQAKAKRYCMVGIMLCSFSLIAFLYRWGLAWWLQSKISVPETDISNKITVGQKKSETSD